MHAVLFPLMAQGHAIPLLDVARLLALRGLSITFVTTPLNSLRFRPTIEKSVSLGLDIKVVALPFSPEASGLPDNCESLDACTSSEMAVQLQLATWTLKPHFDQLIENTLPDFIISDAFLPWTVEITGKLRIPRFAFSGTSCFAVSMMRFLRTFEVPDKDLAGSDDNDVYLEGFPEKISFSRHHLSNMMQSSRDLYKKHPGLIKLGEAFMKAEGFTEGVLANTFGELEPSLIDHYRQISGKNVWPIGPVSLCNSEEDEKAQRGHENTAYSIPNHPCLQWLDAQKENSVVYVCFGSLCALSEAQIVEIAMGLEESDRPFLWVVRGDAIDNSFFADFQERLKERGSIVRGWAPQLLILSHPSVGAFVTHCGWNSILEGVSNGVPLVTWPFFLEQHANERLVVQVWRAGAEVGTVSVGYFGEACIGEVGREDVSLAVRRVLGDEEMRRRAREIREAAKSAVEEGGSSHSNLSLFLDYVLSLKSSRERD